MVPFLDMANKRLVSSWLRFFPWFIFVFLLELLPLREPLGQAQMRHAAFGQRPRALRVRRAPKVLALPKPALGKSGVSGSQDQQLFDRSGVPSNESFVCLEVKKPGVRFFGECKRLLELLRISLHPRDGDLEFLDGKWTVEMIFLPIRSEPEQGSESCFSIYPSRLRISLNRSDCFDREVCELPVYNRRGMGLSQIGQVQVLRNKSFQDTWCFLGGQAILIQKTKYLTKQCQETLMSFLAQLRALQKQRASWDEQGGLPLAIGADIPDLLPADYWPFAEEAWEGLLSDVHADEVLIEIICTADQEQKILTQLQQMGAET
jgi:hypothetical protein